MYIDLAKSSNFPQAGTIDGLTCKANTITEIKITFPKAFSKAVVVTVTPISETTGINGVPKFSVWNVTGTGFTLKIYNDDTGDRSPGFGWIATTK